MDLVDVTQCGLVDWPAIERSSGAGGGTPKKVAA